jgi:hypothetical protein
MRVAIHEFAHALGVTSEREAHGLTRGEAEVAVERVGFLVASTFGLYASGEAIPYIAGWGGEDAKDKVRRFAAVIDSVAKRLEDSILALLDRNVEP